MTGKSSIVVFTCESQHEAELVREAAGRYGHFLWEAGIDTRDYASANAEGAGLGWHAVLQAARDMHRGSRTHMSVLRSPSGTHPPPATVVRKPSGAATCRLRSFLAFLHLVTRSDVFCSSSLILRWSL